MRIRLSSVEAIGDQATIPISSWALFQNVFACSGFVSTTGGMMQFSWCLYTEEGERLANVLKEVALEQPVGTSNIPCPWSFRIVGVWQVWMIFSDLGKLQKTVAWSSRSIMFFEGVFVRLQCFSIIGMSLVVCAETHRLLIGEWTFSFGQM